MTLIDTYVRKNLVLATLTFKKVDFSYTNFENFGVLIVVIHVPKEIPDLRCELIGCGGRFLIRFSVVLFFRKSFAKLHASSLSLLANS